MHACVGRRGALLHAVYRITLFIEKVLLTADGLHEEVACRASCRPSVRTEVEILYISAGEALIIGTVTVLRSGRRIPGVLDQLTLLKVIVGLHRKVHISADLRGRILHLRPAELHDTILIEAVLETIDGLHGNVIAIRCVLLIRSRGEEIPGCVVRAVVRIILVEALVLLRNREVLPA